MMSFFKNLFGGGPPKKATPTASQGLEQLESQTDMLQKRIEHLQDQINEQMNIAKQYANTNKDRAMAALKKKKIHEDNLRKTEAMLDNIESQKNMLESASANAAVLKTMSETAKIVKQEHNNLDINKVEDIVDEIREQKEISDEIANLLTQTTATKNYDEDDLLKELEGMQQEELDAKLISTEKAPTTVKLPDVPTTVPTAQPVASSSSKSPSKQPEDAELDELKKWAAAAQ